MLRLRVCMMRQASWKSKLCRLVNNSKCWTMLTVWNLYSYIISFREESFLTEKRYLWRGRKPGWSTSVNRTWTEAQPRQIRLTKQSNPILNDLTLTYRRRVSHSWQRISRVDPSNSTRWWSWRRRIARTVSCSWRIRHKPSISHSCRPALAATNLGLTMGPRPCRHRRMGPMRNPESPSTSWMCHSSSRTCSRYLR